MDESERPMLLSINSDQPQPSSCTKIRSHSIVALHRIRHLLLPNADHGGVVRQCGRYQMLESAAESKRAEAQRKKHRDRVSHYLTNDDDWDVCGLNREAQDKREDDLASGHTDSTTTDDSLSWTRDVTLDQSFDSTHNSTVEDFSVGHSITPFWDEEAFLLSQLSTAWSRLVEDTNGSDCGNDTIDWERQLFCADKKKGDNKQTNHPSNRGDGTASIIRIEDQRLALEGGPTWCCIETASTRRPTVRLNLAKRANWKYLRDANEILEWQVETKKLRHNRQIIANENNAIRALRSNSRRKKLPFRRGFAAYHAATRCLIMFSMIREEEEQGYGFENANDLVRVGVQPRKQTRWEL